MTRATPIPETVTLHVPFRVVKRGGRKEMQLPDGVRPDRKADNTLVKALARAFRWKQMLESGEFATISELAEREGIAAPYLTRTMRLTQLGPAPVLFRSFESDTRHQGDRIWQQYTAMSSSVMQFASRSPVA